MKSFFSQSGKAEIDSPGYSHGGMDSDEYCSEDSSESLSQKEMKHYFIEHQMDKPKESIYVSVP
jgi:hypothetical protein